MHGNGVQSYKIFNKLLANCAKTLQFNNIRTYKEVKNNQSILRGFLSTGKKIVERIKLILDQHKISKGHITGIFCIQRLIPPQAAHLRLQGADGDKHQLRPKLGPFSSCSSAIAQDTAVY